MRPMTSMVILALICALISACGSGGGGDSGGGTPPPPPATNPTRAPFITGAEASVTPVPSAVSRVVTSAADTGSGSLRDALSLALAGVLQFLNLN